jgi:hypothetical protein
MGEGMRTGKNSLDHDEIAKNGNHWSLGSILARHKDAQKATNTIPPVIDGSGDQERCGQKVSQRAVCDQKDSGGCSSHSPIVQIFTPAASRADQIELGLGAGDAVPN